MAKSMLQDAVDQASARGKAVRIKREFRALVKLPSTDKVLKQTEKEYISEAEHQDGREYWLNFKNGKQAFADLKMYCKNKAEMTSTCQHDRDDAGRCRKCGEYDDFKQ